MLIKKEHRRPIRNMMTISAVFQQALVVADVDKRKIIIKIIIIIIIMVILKCYFSGELIALS